jgi:hypothetical protein
MSVGGAAGREVAVSDSLPPTAVSLELSPCISASLAATVLHISCTTVSWDAGIALDILAPSSAFTAPQSLCSNGKLPLPASVTIAPRFGTLGGAVRAYCELMAGNASVAAGSLELRVLPTTWPVLSDIVTVLRQVRLCSPFLQMLFSAHVVVVLVKA